MGDHLGNLRCRMLFLCALALLSPCVHYTSRLTIYKAIKQEKWFFPSKRVHGTERRHIVVRPADTYHIRYHLVTTSEMEALSLTYHSTDIHVGHSLVDLRLRTLGS